MGQAMSGVEARLERGVRLDRWTTFEVGGPARFFARARTPGELAELFAWGSRRGLPVLLLGGGSNLLIADRGFDGLVVRVEIGAGEVHHDAATGIASGGAGETWDRFVSWTVEHGLAGVECMAGIPGLVGATPVQNVGAYGQEVADTIVDVDVLDRTTGEAFTLAREACDFRYRDSAFKQGWRGRYVITRVRFALRPGGAPTIKYPELARHLRASGSASPTLAEVRAAIVALRRSKSMVRDANDENHRSAGSFFTNPIVAPEIAGEAKARWRARDPSGAPMPEFPSSEGVKLSAAWLIERSGFAKGTARGRAGISSRHCLALVNRGGASASEIVALAREVRLGVLEAFGVPLSAEPELVGFDRADIADLAGPGAPL
jgi:UDP-N-acetylmuramate dehydrogenase